MNNAIEIKELSLSIEGHTILENISFGLGEIGIACLLGPSGCGKTSLLRCIAGFEELNYGEVWIKGRNVIGNYWSDEHTKENLVDGWLKTGDLGRIDNGYLYILGRVDDLINISGEKVYPQEIERVVKVLTGIDDVIAVPMKHEVFGEVVKLFVKKSVESDISKTDILTHCIKNLERFKVPAKIEFVEDFPRTDYGKIKRFMLK